MTNNRDCSCGVKFNDLSIASYQDATLNMRAYRILCANCFKFTHISSTDIEEAIRRWNKWPIYNHYVIQNWIPELSEKSCMKCNSHNLYIESFEYSGYPIFMGERFKIYRYICTNCLFIGNDFYSKERVDSYKVELVRELRIIKE